MSGGTWGGLSPEVKDFIAGAVGGVAGVVAGQPLDTLRVRLQQPSSSRKTLWQAGSVLMSSEGWRGLFKGMSYPLATNALQNAVTFNAYGIALRHLTGPGGNPGGTSSSATPGYMSVFLAGMFAGLVQCAVVVPVELLKIRMQLQNAAPDCPSYVGPLQMLKDVVRKDGWTGVYRGTLITLLRDTPSYGVYFLVYVCGCDLLTAASPKLALSPTFSQAVTQLTAGGLAGMVAWGSIYPLDVVKSRWQARGSETSRYQSYLHCVTKSYQEEGLSVFGRGLGATLGRAFVVNAVIFAAYTACMRELNHLQPWW